MVQTQLLLESVTVATAMMLMVRTGGHYKLLVRRPPRHCASCGRRLPCDCQ
jgi:hypothetical protein